MALNNLPEDYVCHLLKIFSLLKYCNVFIFDDNVSRFRQIFPFFYKIPCMIVFFITNSLYIFNLFEEDVDYNKLADFAVVNVLCIITYLTLSEHLVIIRAVIVIHKKKKIRVFILRLGSIWRNTDLSEEQIEKKNEKLKRLNSHYTAFYWSAFYGSWMYIMAPLFETLFRRFVLQQECEFQLLFDGVYPFEPKKDWLTYLGVYIFQTYSVFHIMYFFLGTETLLNTLTSHLSTEFTLLRYDLVNIAPETDRNNSDLIERNEGPSMKDFIQKHQKLIRLFEDLDDIFNVIIFTYFGGVSIIICFLLVAMIASNGAMEYLKNLVPVLSSSFSIFSECFYAEVLKEASSSIGDAAYQNLWYQGSKKHKFAIWFIMKRSEKPCCLTAMKLKSIGLSTFMSVMNTAWSYFSLVSTVSQD